MKTPFLRVPKPLFYATLALIVLGFGLMAIDTEEYGYGSLGLTVGPIVLFAGFVLPFFTIMKAKPEQKLEVLGKN